MSPSAESTCLFNISRIFSKCKKYFSLNAGRDGGKVLCLPHSCLLPLQRIKVHWASLTCPTEGFLMRHPLVALLKTFFSSSLLLHLALVTRRLGKYVCGEVCMWKGIAAWAKTWDLNAQLCPNSIESETWAVTAGQVIKTKFSFAFCLYRNTPSKQQQQLEIFFF